jgi:hypothetical protein
MRIVWHLHHEVLTWKSWTGTALEQETTNGAGSPNFGNFANGASAAADLVR